LEILIFFTTNNDHWPLLRQSGNFKANLNAWKTNQKIFFLKLSNKQPSKSLLSFLI
jgi:hypothetical protein